MLFVGLCSADRFLGNAVVKFRLLKETWDSIPVRQLLNIILVHSCTMYLGARGGPVGWGTELQPGFDTRWCQWDLSSFRRRYDPEVHAASDRNEFQEYFLRRGGVGRRTVHRANKLTTFTGRLSCSLGASPTWNLQSLSGPVVGLLYFFLPFT